MIAREKSRIGLAAALIISLLAGCGQAIETPIAVTATHTAIPATDTPKPTSTATPTPTPTKIYQPSPRWMMLNQPGYNTQILGEEWKYFEDSWGDEYGCTKYQYNDYEKWFEQCFAYSTAISYDEILAPFLEKGFEALEPQNKFTNVNRTDLVAQRSSDNLDRVRLLQQIETDRYFMLVEMVVTSPGDLPLQTVYETLAVDVLEFVFQDMLVNSRAVPAPTSTPLSPGQKSLFSELGGLLITEADLEAGWEATGDNVPTTDDRVCRYFELRVNEDASWVHLINCIYHKPSNFNVHTLVRANDVLFGSSYAHEDDFIMYGRDAGRFYYDAWLFKDGLLYLSALESRVFGADTVEGVFTKNIDDLLNHVLMINLGTQFQTRSSTPDSPFIGDWVSTDPGDGSTQRLSISENNNGAYNVNYTDDAAWSCGQDNAGRAIAATGTGVGTVNGNVLGVDFIFYCLTDPQSFLQSARGYFTYDETTETIANDGTVWSRSNGAHAGSLVFRDDFNGAVNSEWSWIRADSSQWSLTNNPGFLHVNLTNTTDVYEGGADTLFLRWIEAENFEMVTQVVFEPKRNFQRVGLVIYENRENFVALLRAYADVGANPGNAIYFDNISPFIPGYDDADYQNFATPITNPSNVYLKLRREGGTYTGYYSLDGQSWMLIGVHTSPIAPVSFGLLIGKSDQPISADFDFFELYSLP